MHNEESLLIVSVDILNKVHLSFGQFSLPKNDEKS